MDRKLDLSSALQRRIVGSQVSVQLNRDIAELPLSDLMRLDDIGADFVDGVLDPEGIPTETMSCECEEISFGVEEADCKKADNR